MGYQEGKSRPSKESVLDQAPLLRSFLRRTSGSYLNDDFSFLETEYENLNERVSSLAADGDDLWDAIEKIDFDARQKLFAEEYDEGGYFQNYILSILIGCGWEIANHEYVDLFSVDIFRRLISDGVISAVTARGGLKVVAQLLHAGVELRNSSLETFETFINDDLRF